MACLSGVVIFPRVITLSMNNESKKFQFHVQAALKVHCKVKLAAMGKNSIVVINTLNVNLSSTMSRLRVNALSVRIPYSLNAIWRQARSYNARIRNAGIFNKKGHPIDALSDLINVPPCSAFTLLVQDSD